MLRDSNDSDAAGGSAGAHAASHGFGVDMLDNALEFERSRCATTRPLQVHPAGVTRRNRFELVALETVAVWRSHRCDCQVRLPFVHHCITVATELFRASLHTMTPELLRDNSSYYTYL